MAEMFKSAPNDSLESKKKTQPQQKQLTARAIAIGLFLGCFLCFSNTYFGLQTGWVTMGSLQSALAGFGLLRLCNKLNIGGPHSKLELNMIQTIAVASATMPLAAGFVGIIPALALLDPDSGGPVTLTISQLFIWTLSLASFGVFLAIPLRKYMIIKEQLPFPSGTATAKMIELFYNDTEPNISRRNTPNDTNNDQLLLQYALDLREPEALKRDDSHNSDVGQTDLIITKKVESQTSLSLVKEFATRKRQNQSIVIRTESHPNTLNHELIEIEMVYDKETSSMNQWKVFLFTFISSSLIIIAQYFIPIMHYLPLFGATASVYLWNIDISLCYVGQGMIAGTRVGLSMLLGCIIGWCILGPYAISRHFVLPNSQTEDWQNSESGWLLWVSLCVMLGESLTSLFIILMKSIIAIICCQHKQNVNYKSIQHEAEMSALKNYKASFNNAQLQETLLEGCETTNTVTNAHDEDDVSSIVWISGLFCSCILCVISLSLIPSLEIQWFEAALALVFALIISILSVRALGETDMNPVSGVSKVSQIFFSVLSPGNIVGNLIAGAMSEASAMQSGDMLQSFKTGYLLSASARLQFYGVLIGSIASVIFSVFAYYLFISAYPDIPNEEFQVPAAELWLNMAQLLNGGSIASNVKYFCVGGAATGALLSLCNDVIFRGNEYIPSGVALAIGFYITPNYVIPRVVGSLLQFVWRQRNKNSFDQYMIVVASGFVLGEGVFSIIKAAMKAAQVPCCFVK